MGRGAIDSHLRRIYDLAGHRHRKEKGWGVGCKG